MATVPQPRVELGFAMNEFNPYQPTAAGGVDLFDAVADEQILAPRSERFVGAFIDGVIQIALVVPLAFGLGMVIGIAFGDSSTVMVLSQVAGGIVGVAVFLAVNGYLLATQGKTVGKLVVKTKIVDRETGALLPFGPLILKRYAWLWVVAIIPMLNIVVPLLNALMIFRSSRACLHDDIAGTKVIKG